ncbi:hypothetical protein [Alistipes senegalensis]|uniref:hypothetical protein n=2 Tax=Alistipes senegalensis TaxID=1288121 RepID=UPI0018AAE40B|nr:hypothetical protein [Alistipes senegalensis]
MTRFSNKNSDLWPRLEMVIRWSHMSVYAFARHIGLPRGENLYQIKRGNNGLSLHLADMICEKFPEIDELWLLTGKNNMFLSMDKCRCREAAPDPMYSATSGPVDPCRLCIAGRILPVLLQKGACDPIDMALRYAEDLISKSQRIERL